MDLNLADSLLELDAEDLTEIYHMVSEWEFNFGSLEVSATVQVIITIPHYQASPGYYRDLTARIQTLLYKLTRHRYCLVQILT